MRFPRRYLSTSYVKDGRFFAAPGLEFVVTDPCLDDFQFWSVDKDRDPGLRVIRKADNPVTDDQGRAIFIEKKGSSSCFMFFGDGGLEGNLVPCVPI